MQVQEYIMESGRFSRNYVKIKQDCSQWYTIPNTRLFTFDLDFRAKVTQNAVQYPLHHVTYAPAKFGVAVSNA